MADAGGKLYLSVNGGALWSQIYDFTTAGGIMQLELSPGYGSDSTLGVVTGGYALMLSTDGGYSYVPRGRGYDFNQALMDFGATVCSARKPLCRTCPLRSGCRSYPFRPKVTRGRR